MGACRSGNRSRRYRRSAPPPPTAGHRRWRHRSSAGMPGTNSSARGVRIMAPMAIICTAVLNLAMAVTGTLTRVPARNSRRPETRISRDRMISAGTSRSRLKAAPVVGIELAEGAFRHQHHQRHRHQHLVGDGVQHAAEIRAGLQLAGGKAVQPVADPGDARRPAKATSRAASPGMTKATAKTGTSTMRRMVRALGRANMGGV